jgi:hypothetical protein
VKLGPITLNLTSGHQLGLRSRYLPVIDQLGTGNNYDNKCATALRDGNELLIRPSPNYFAGLCCWLYGGFGRIVEGTEIERRQG